MTTTTRQQRRLERAWKLPSAPIPPRPRRPWLVLAVGIGAGLSLGIGTRWLTLPFAPEPAVNCKFYLSPISEEKLANLRPTYPPELARRWAPGGDLYKHLGSQGPTQAQLQQAQPEPPREAAECVR